MKRVLIIIPILFLIYSIGYCEEIHLDNGTKASTPPDVVKALLQAIEEKNWEAACLYLSSEFLAEHEQEVLAGRYFMRSWKKDETALYTSQARVSPEWEKEANNTVAIVTLNLGGEKPDALHGIGRVKLVDEGGQWKVAEFPYPNYNNLSLQLTIKSDKEVYEVGDAINIEVLTKNLKDIQLSLGGHFEIASPLMIWGPLGPLGEKIIVLEPGREMKVSYNLYDLKWNKQYSSIWPNNPLSDFLKAGKYSITFVLQGGDSERFTSNAINLKIIGADYPASIMGGKAKVIAEGFMSKQHYKNTYEEKSSIVKEFDNYVDCYFKRKIPSRVKGDGLVRVDKNLWKAEWIASE